MANEDRGATIVQAFVERKLPHQADTPYTTDDDIRDSMLADVWQFCRRLNATLDAMGPQVAGFMHPDSARDFLSQIGTPSNVEIGGDYGADENRSEVG